MPSAKAAAVSDSRFAFAPDDEFDEAVDAMQKRNKQQRESTDRKGKGRTVDASTKKRKRPAKEAEPEEGEEEPDLYDEVLNGPLPSTSKSAQRAPGEEARSEGNDEGGNSDDEQVDDGADDSDGPLNLLPKPLQLDQLAAYNSKVDRTGLIYLSRIPPGMGPSKVKHILSSYGDIGRIYLVAADAQGSGSSRNGGGGKASSATKHRPHRFVEGWVEFLDKKVARHTAELLNARSIGDVSLSRGSKRNGGTKKWKDDVWTMKYLPKFKWNMLSEQVAIEAATRAALLRNEISASKKEQSSYLAQVERAKNHTKAQEKKRARLERRDANESAGTEPAEAAKAKTGPAGKGRNFDQRQAVQQSGKGVDAALGSVLDSLF